MEIYNTNEKLKQKLSNKICNNYVKKKKKNFNCLKEVFFPNFSFCFEYNYALIALTEKLRNKRTYTIQYKANHN